MIVGVESHRDLPLVALRGRIGTEERLWNRKDAPLAIERLRTTYCRHQNLRNTEVMISSY